MSPADPETPAPAPQPGSTTERMTVRRAPNMIAFLVTGAAVGAIAGLLVGALGPGALAYTRGAIIGFFLMTFLIVGATVGAVVALVLDRISHKRSRRVTAQVQELHGTDEHPRP